jgi:transcriptional antiterminator
MNEQYVVSKVLSNNVVISERENKFYIFTGKGIGFGKQKGNIIDNSSIEQKFVAVDKEEKENYRKILQNVDKEIVAVTGEIISQASQKLNENLDFRVHVTLSDHIDFAIKRINEGIDIQNPFLFEIQIMYPAEYSIAQSGIELLDKRLNIRLPESEIGFIALHIYSARVNQSVAESLKYTSTVKEIIDFIQNELCISIKDKSNEYARLISHLRYALYRIDNGKVFKNILLPSVKKQLEDEFKISKKVCKLIQEKLGKPVPKDEIGYIAVHLGRLKNKI